MIRIEINPSEIKDIKTLQQIVINKLNNVNKLITDVERQLNSGNATVESFEATTSRYYGLIDLRHHLLEIAYAMGIRFIEEDE